MPKGHAFKLLPKYIRLYVVLDAKPETLSHQLNLAHLLKQRQIHDVFYVSELW